MGDVQPKAADLEAPLPFGIVITALQGQKHPALSDAQRRCLAALSPALIVFHRCTKTRGADQCTVCRYFVQNEAWMMEYHLPNGVVA